MQLSHKLKKLGSGRALQSAQRQSPLLRRPSVPLDPESLTKAIEGEELEAIRQRHVIENPGIAWPKYFDLPRWMKTNLQRVRALGLDWGLRKRILDLGCGAGYFLFIAQCLGHEVLGLDIDEVPMFGEMTLMLGIGRVVWQIKPFERLPKLGRKFDLITAFMICFNGHKSPTLWGRAEGEFFLDDLETHLAPHGGICLGFNREDDGSFYSEELREYFADREARLEKNRALITRRAVIS
ncbi:MAG: class I SAM-dependent methyltransferase [Chthoniobacterales bacterium]|nr:class I SAM-dependent methyltransferase [Chthoniobacterales bacterium]